MRMLFLVIAALPGCVETEVHSPVPRGQSDAPQLRANTSPMPNAVDVSDSGVHLDSSALDMGLVGDAQTEDVDRHSSTDGTVSAGDATQTQNDANILDAGGLLTPSEDAMTLHDSVVDSSPEDEPKKPIEE